MTYQIRHIEPADAEAVHRILTSPHVVDGTMRLPVAALAATERRIAYEDGMYKLVAVSDGSVVGFSELITHPRFPRHAHAGDINMIVSSADMQGRGVGRALMQHMVELADQWLGLVRLGLIVWANNERAIKLYEQFGFETEGVSQHVWPVRVSAISLELSQQYQWPASVPLAQRLCRYALCGADMAIVSVGHFGAETLPITAAEASNRPSECQKKCKKMQENAKKCEENAQNAMVLQKNE